jgi:hypothetical protein
LREVTAGGLLLLVEVEGVVEEDMVVGGAVLVLGGLGADADSDLDLVSSSSWEGDIF